MRITFLGTGTSYGIPMPACDCDVCRSTDPHDKRLRSSVWVEADGYSLLIDTAPDLRAQALAHRIRQVDAVLMTHDHADHIFGLDDLRPFSNHKPAPIPVYASGGTARTLRHIFSYIWQAPVPGTSLARIELHEVARENSAFLLGPFEVTPLPVQHGRADTFGWKIQHQNKTFAYIPDCKILPEATVQRCRNVDVAVLDALRMRPHPTHMNLTEAADCLQNMNARQQFVTHLCHEVSHQEADSLLPENISPAFDGLQIELNP